jgi:selenium metabolism protein YedF
LAIESDLMLFLGSAVIGDGEPDLGEKLMQNYLKMILESGRIPSKVICMNSGVFLTTEGSQVLETLESFRKEGAEILSCGTCLDYYGRSDQLKVGKPTDMKATVAAMLSFKKILSPC